MKIEDLSVGRLETNCYVVSDDDKNCLIIDLGGGFSIVNSYIRSSKLKPVAVLATHGHADHIADAGLVGVPVYIHELDAPFLTDEGLNCSNIIGCSVNEIERFETFKEGRLKIGGFDFEVVHTAGHTVGSCCFYFPKLNALFSGDTLMCASFGRYDLPTGSFESVQSSVERLLTRFDDSVVVYTGHGLPTTIGYEKKVNPLAPKC